MMAPFGELIKSIKSYNILHIHYIWNWFNDLQKLKKDMKNDGGKVWNYDDMAHSRQNGKIVP